MIGVGVATFWYFARVREWPSRLALAIAVATVVTPAFVFLATSAVMAECVFTLGQLITVLILERAVRDDETSRWGDVVLAAGAAIATTLVRATGIALVAAGMLFLLNARRWRRAAIFAAAAALCYAPWALYARAHEPTPLQRMEHGGPMAHAYTELVQVRVAGTVSSGRATFDEFRSRVTDNLANVFGRDMVGMLAPVLLRDAGESGLEVVSLGRIGHIAGSMGNSPATMVISFVLAAAALIGWIKAWRERPELPELLVPLTIIMVVMVPVWTFRYVVPLTPFIIGYLVEALRTRGSDPWRLARIAVLCVIGFDLYDHTRYALDLHSAANVNGLDWVEDGREVDDLLAWMRTNLVTEGGVATTNPALIYLRTGRKTVAMDDCAGRIAMWRAHGIRYLASLRPLELPDASCGPYRVLYQSARRHLWVIGI